MNFRAKCSLVLAFFFVAACSVETQKARESFDSNHLPPQLAKLANQTLELRPLKEEIINRVDQDKNIFTLPIAVIDNGVDLAHPDLVSKYAFRIEKGEIAGVGHDFMGDDEFSSSCLINPEIFTFTAKEIKNGLIVIGDQNPFDLMLDLDQKISAAFLAKIKADPILSQSVFSRLSIRSFNAFGLFRIVNDESKKNIFSPSLYNDVKAEGKLLTLDFRQKAQSNEILAKAWGLENIYHFLDYPDQLMDAGTGLPTMTLFINNIEHGDRFVQKVKETFAELPEGQILKDAIAKLVEFRIQRDHTPAPDRTDAANSAAQTLSQALQYHKQGISATDPILDLRVSTMRVALSGMDLFRKPQDFPSVQVTPDFVAANVKTSQDRIEDYRALLNEIPLSAQEKFKVRGFDRTFVKTKAMNQAYLAERGSELPLIYDANFHSQYTSLLRKYFFRTKHPFYSQLSEKEVHGTHVSGIVAKQNEALRIYPIRVTTRSALLTHSEYLRMVQKYKDEFKLWLQAPIVTKAIVAKFGKMLPLNYQEPKTSAERLEFATLLMESMNEAIDMAFESGTMDFIFFDELKQALRHVGEKKIKVANISLGAEQKNEIPSLAAIDPEKDLPAVFSFLNFEFLKFQIGEILSTVSKGTLFVVAAGNSSTWVDGKSHSALPVDVTSRFLAPFENGTDLIAANNHLNNVLGVGSLSPDEDLSGFTNVILGMTTPMIFAVGEKILSPVKATDLSPILTVIGSHVSGLMQEMPVSPFDLRLINKFKEKNTQLEDSPEIDGKIGQYYSMGLAEMDTVVTAFSTQLAIQFNDHREYLSGTSMATPAVVGTIGDQIVKRAQTLGLKPEDVYDHPEMTPSQLIKNLKAIGKPLFPENPEYPFQKVDIRGKYDRGEKGQRLEQKLKLILKAS